MQPCYIVSYYLQGVCAVDANAVTNYHDEETGGFNRCHLYFNDGSDLRLEEDCEAFELKRQACTPNPAGGMLVFPRKAFGV